MPLSFFCCLLLIRNVLTEVFGYCFKLSGNHPLVCLARWGQATGLSVLHLFILCPHGALRSLGSQFHWLPEVLLGNKNTPLPGFKNKAGLFTFPGKSQ